ncbi:MAG: transcription-repair coupling factor [Verrucomicrobiota bacterium]
MNDPLGAFRLAENDTRHLGGEFSAGRVAYVQSLSTSAQAYLAWALRDLLRTPLIWVTDSPRTLDALHQDLLALGGGRASQLSCFPARESVPGRSGPPHPDLIGDRLNTLQRCLGLGGAACLSARSLAKADPQDAPPARVEDNASHQLIITTCIQAVLQKTPPPKSLRRFSTTLSRAQEIDPDEIVRLLEEAGYEFEPEVQQKGHASRRGGLLDLWPPTETWPVRLEFFGNVVESIRTFDPVEQRSLEKLGSIVLSPAEEAMDERPGSEGRVPSAGSDILSYLPPHTLFAWSEPESIRHHAETYRAMIPEADPERDAARFDQLRLRVETSFGNAQLVLGLDVGQAAPAHELDLRPWEGLPALTAPGAGRAGEVLHPDMLSEARRRFVIELGRRAEAGQQVHLFFHTEGARDRFLETYGRDSGAQRLMIHVGPLSEGFASESLGLVVVSESDLYGFRRALPGRYELQAAPRGTGARRPGPARMAGLRIAEWTDIQPGELVVHVDHGIGKYLGLYEIEFQGQQQEVLAIEYADKAKLYVPVSQTHLLSRYVGMGRRRPDLHALGGRRWTREKLAAEKAVRDLASALLETQARRDVLDGHAFAKDAPWQHEFEAAFPYQETEDQHRAIAETKVDMESRRPMDRLICGDVGYGKTEVAMRAAFKAVMDGRQVAVLVPTTVLAQQHYDTFTERMAAYPLAIEMLSRFRTRAEQREIVRRVASGEVDIVIGTHRLLQRDVKFHELGLVIIDEEQRFGVAHKEHLKHLRELVDVLTLTATPIPRTLYMSLTGAKDMSTIQTPPQDRLPVETLVTQNTDDVVRAAVLREINRGGQVFYLHNRVISIEGVRERLERLVPEATIEVGHGQMHERELAGIMHRFVRREFDVLLCTTIIESGVDIPNVNTILIDRADRFGMADLYQLRGRVGRYKHKAYAYLLLPRHGQLFDNARRRIGAIKRYSSLGAGFKLALRDLEIRGAGNILGAQQSGHIAAVGFDLYCQLLKRTVARMKGEPVPPIIEVQAKLDFIDLSLSPAREESSAVIPSTYVEDENLRVNLYRRVAAAATEQEIDALGEEIRDRFGPVPEPLDRLLSVARLRIVASGQGVQSIEVREGKVMMMRGGEYLMKSGRFPRLKPVGTTQRLDELLGIVRSWS